MISGNVFCIVVTNTLFLLLCRITSTAIGSSVIESETNAFLSCESKLTYLWQKNTCNSVKNIWKSYIWPADKDVNESDPCSNVHYCPSTAHYCEDHFHSHVILLADERAEEKEKLLLRACSQPRREFCYSSSL